MPRYDVYLETDATVCLAHILALPGLCVRAPSCDEALARLPDAVREYWAWLRSHGEPPSQGRSSAAPAEDEPVEVSVAGESSGFGPFNPGDACALFEPDREPVTPEDMEGVFRLMGYNRADLLALVAGPYGDEMLDWRPDPGAFPIRRILRHVGNAEEWYVSRLVPPDTLPPEWEHDEDLPLLEFLEMERSTAIERLRRLTGEQRRAVVRPAAWTDHPEEEWTARKSLRRFVEHEREHIGQVREVLAARRQDIFGTLAGARAALLAEVNLLDDRTIASEAVMGGWTVGDVLVHVAAWDRWLLPQMQRVAAGEPPDLEVADDMDAFNAAALAAWRGRPLGEVIVELHAARTALLAWLEGLAPEALLRRYVVHGEDWSFPDWLRVFWAHDEDHAAQIASDIPRAGA